MVCTTFESDWRDIIRLGFLAGGVIWIATAVHFFGEGKNFLGLVSLLIPPSEIVLPWLVSREFGIASVVSTGLLVTGATPLGFADE